MRNMNYIYITFLPFLLFSSYMETAFSRIEVDHTAPHKLNYRGKNIVLIGGGAIWTTMDDADSVLHDYGKKGINYLRFWNILPWDREKQLMPWKRVPGRGKDNDGMDKYDLTQWNDEYWDHVRHIAETARTNNIIIDWMLFDDVGLENRNHRWPHNPFNPQNNVNNLGLSYSSADGNGNGQFHDLNNKALLEIQIAYLKKTFKEVGSYGNVIFQLENESDADYYWGKFFIKIIHDAGFISLHNPFIDQSSYLRDPNLDIYAVHNLTGKNTNQWMNDNYGKEILLQYEEQDSEQSATDVLHIIWGSLLASGLYTWDEIKGEGNSYITEYSEYAANFFREHVKDYSLMNPCNNNVVSGNAYCISNPGKEYIFFSYSENSITVNIGNGNNVYKGVWYDPSKGQVVKRFSVPGGSSVFIEKPQIKELVLYLIDETGVKTQHNAGWAKKVVGIN
jgi:hypothetical protein